MQACCVQSIETLDLRARPFQSPRKVRALHIVAVGPLAPSVRVVQLQRRELGVREQRRGPALRQPEQRRGGVVDVTSEPCGTHVAIGENDAQNNKS